MRGLLCIALLASHAAAADWIQLFNGKNLDGWEVVGDGLWGVMRDGTLLGQRDLYIKYDPKPEINQSWLYTKREFGEYDLHLDWWTRYVGNSGVSIRDTSRARHAVVGPDNDRTKSPAHIGYEIQINNHYKDNYTSGSIYLFDKAKAGFQHDDDWNAMDLEVRDSGIKVTLNGELVSQYPGEAGRPLTGPIGLQLHDQNSVVMFRNIKIREITNSARH